MKIIIVLFLFVILEHDQNLKIITICGKIISIVKKKTPKKGKNFLAHKYGSKTLRLKDVIHPDLECILEDYHTNQNDESIP